MEERTEQLKDALAWFAMSAPIDMHNEGQKHGKAVSQAYLAAEEELSDIKETYANTIAEPCSDINTTHCACVPALRSVIDRLKELLNSKFQDRLADTMAAHWNEGPSIATKLAAANRINEALDKELGDRTHELAYATEAIERLKAVDSDSRFRSLLEADAKIDALTAKVKDLEDGMAHDVQCLGEALEREADMRSKAGEALLLLGGYDITSIHHGKVGVAADILRGIISSLRPKDDEFASVSKKPDAAAKPRRCYILECGCLDVHIPRTE